MPLFGHCLCGNGYLFGAGFEDCDHKRLVGIKSVLNLLSQVALCEERRQGSREREGKRRKEEGKVERREGKNYKNYAKVIII